MTWAKALGRIPVNTRDKFRVILEKLIEKRGYRL